MGPSACDFVVDFECVGDASVASPKQQAGLRTFGGCVADVIDDGVVACDCLLINNTTS